MLQFKHVIHDNEEFLELPYVGKEILSIPQFNKGTAFTDQERHMFQLIGKLPEHIETIDQQAERAYQEFLQEESPLEKNTFLNRLHKTNNILFFYLVRHHLEEMIPIIYTPTVGDAVIEFSHHFQQAWGLYISYEQRHHIREILKNRSHPNIKVMVVSDGGGVLGIGDQGAGAIIIPTTKLMVYTLFANINPFTTLPIMLDVGTDNETLLNDPMYLGWRHHRISGKDYDDFIAQFVAAVKEEFPNIFLHWEDFGRDNAWRTLTRYRHEVCTFNDDIQGTGAVTLAAIKAGIRSNDSTLQDQRIVVFGAGTAGTGIADQIVEAMLESGLSKQQALNCFWLIDKPGLLTNNITDLTDAQTPYARDPNEITTWEIEDKSYISLYDVVKNIHPTLLIGCSARHGAFDEKIITEMASHVERPMIFPLSNPTSKAEAIPDDIIKWTEGKALIATGSPFPAVEFKGNQIPIGQCNNALVYPGLGLGVIAAQAKEVTDNMLNAACQALAEKAPTLQDPLGALLPAVHDAPEIAPYIALAVAKQAIKDNVAGIPKDANLTAILNQLHWEPNYIPFKLAKDK